MALLFVLFPTITIGHAAEGVTGFIGPTRDEDVSVDQSDGPPRWRDPNEPVWAGFLGLVGKVGAQHR